MGTWSRIGDQDNPTGLRYTYSTKKEETTGNKDFSLKPYLFDTNFSNKATRSPSLEDYKIIGVKISYLVTSGYKGTWKVQGKFIDTNGETQLSSISNGFVVNATYKRITHTFNFNEYILFKNFVINNNLDFKIHIVETGYGTLHWYADTTSGGGTYIELIIGEDSGGSSTTPSIKFISPEENETFNQLEDIIEVVLDSSSPPAIKLNGGTEETITETSDDGYYHYQTSSPWPYNEDVTISAIAGGNTITRLVKVVNPGFFTLTPTYTRMKKDNNDEYINQFDGEYIKLKLDCSINNNSFIPEGGQKQIGIQFFTSDTPPLSIGNGISLTINKNTESFSEIYSFGDNCTVSSNEEKTITIKIILEPNSNTNPKPVLLSQNLIISKATPIFNIEENGVAIGQFSEGSNNDKRFEVADNYTSYFNGPVTFKQPITAEINGITKFESNVESDNSTQIGAFGNYPIYMSQFIKTLIPNPTKPSGVDWYSIDIKTGLSTSVHLIHAYGYITFGTSGSEFPINYFQSASNFSMGYLYQHNNSKDFVIHCQNNANIPLSYMIILIYYDTSSSLSS